MKMIKSTASLLLCPLCITLVLTLCGCTATGGSRILVTDKVHETVKVDGDYTPVMVDLNDKKSEPGHGVGSISFEFEHLR